jgi:hypothetical protein
MSHKLILKDRVNQDGVFARHLESRRIAGDLCSKLTERILINLTEASPLEVADMGRNALVEYFARVKLINKFDLVKSWQKEEITCLKYRDYVDFTIEPVSVDFKRVKIFEIRPYASGIAERFSTGLDPSASCEYHHPQVVHDTFSEYAAWAKLLDGSAVAELNEIISQRKIDELKWIADGLYEQKFVVFFEVLVLRFSKKGIVRMGSPSSSNKTTFANRPAIGIPVHGHQSLVIEMDN